MGLIDYIRLTSPGITLLVLLTGFTGMWIASRGMVSSLSLFLWGLLGIGLASAGSSVFNNYYDRDIDSLMSRTSRRPLPSRKIRPGNALVFGTGLSAVAVVILAICVNLTACFLAILAIVVYAFLYTVVLKRRSPLATEIGGISGALPPVIGWSAVRGGIDIEALILFGIMFLWQPPHFWSLASRYRDDYKRAGIPTMPVVSSKDETTMRSLTYIVSLFVVSLLPYLIGMFGELYLFISITLGIIYLSLYLMTLLLKRDLNSPLFIYSIIYLSLLFLCMVVDIRG
jgi:protoheme IX farnesyltransferase